jgi:DNA-binding Xre family transcriptional regulator
VKITSRFKVLLAEKELRDKRGYTMRDVASATKVSIYTITALANNTLREFPIEALSAVCGFLGCTTGELLVFDDTKTEDDSGAKMDEQLMSLSQVAAVTHADMVEAH